MKRMILAYLEIDDDLAFEKIDDGPIAYLEKESGWLAQSGIFITDAAIADADAADPKEAYLVYLARFAFDHLGDGKIYPLPYEQCAGFPLGQASIISVTGAQSISAPQSIYQNKGVYEYEQRNLLR